MTINDSAWGVCQRGSGDATVIYLAAQPTTSRVAKLPVAWGDGDYWVNLLAIDNDCRYQFSNNSTAVVAVTAGTATGASGTTAGGVLTKGVEKPVKVPQGCVYFAFITKTGTSDVAVELRSDPSRNSV